MTDLATAPAPPANGQRSVTRRRGLPGGRAVVGGFLVAASASAVFAAWNASSGGPTTSYAVVVGDVAAGERLEAEDLALVALELPPDQRRLAFADTGTLVGAVALAPMRDGQLVQVSDVARPAGAPERAQISLRLDPGNAVGGDLRPGDTVDVIVTYTTGGQPVTSTVSHSAQVVRVLTGDQRVGASGSIVVVLAVLPAELEPIAGAAAAGHVTIARTTGVAGR